MGTARRQENRATSSPQAAGRMGCGSSAAGSSSAGLVGSASSARQARSARVTQPHRCRAV